MKRSIIKYLTMDHEILLYNELVARFPKALAAHQSVRIMTPRSIVYFGVEGFAIYENDYCVCYYDVTLGVCPGEYFSYPVAFSAITMTLADIVAGDYEAEE